MKELHTSRARKRWNNTIATGSLIVVSALGGLHVENYADILPGTPYSWVQESGSTPGTKSCSEQIDLADENVGNAWVRELAALGDTPKTLTKYFEVRVGDSLSYWVCIANKLTGEVYVYPQPDRPTGMPAQN